MLASDYLPNDFTEGQGFQALMIINNLELELDRIFVISIELVRR